MTLETVIQDKAKIPTGLEAHYVETDGVFVLDAKGMKTQEDFDRYADALKKRYADAGADFAKKQGGQLSRDDIMEIVENGLKKFAGEGGTPPGKANGSGGDAKGKEDVSARLHDLERNVASLTEANSKLQGERDAALGDARSTTIRNTLSQVAVKAGVAPEGVDNLVTLVAPNFEVAQDGNVVTKLDAGNGVSPNQAPGDFFSTLARNSSYRMFWPKSVGGGADQGAGGGGGVGDLGAENPWTKAGWNVTKQGQLFSKNRGDAERLMKVAGVKLGDTVPVR